MYCDKEAQLIAAKFTWEYKFATVCPTRTYKLSAEFLALINILALFSHLDKTLKRILYTLADIFV